MQSFDPETRCGTVVSDDGVRFPFDAHAMATGGLRHVRPGQRLTVGLDEGGRHAVHLSLGTIKPSAAV